MLPPFRQEHHVPEANARPEPSLVRIPRPRCPTCQGRTMLICIEPGRNGLICEPSNAPNANTSIKCSPSIR